ncbi:MAG: hypothetical protein OEV49_04435 [candidate division Zixibacteria bacterium]|nr:hypothetical protein [candidate division Zixibacteria bacterium]MDH3936157.1 hypothetical protein [candidate division Zixibacteria bacterium]MDH4032991.1 hypothetical protein [candidate division Zixibacteria bacterium]
MRRLVLITMLAVLFMATTAGAFDGLRKGFVLGGGLGVAAQAEWSVDFLGFPVGEDGTGLGVNFIIGYGWDEQNMIVYEGNVAAWKGDISDADIVQGFNGAAWYHYFGPVGKSFFTVGGLGAYIFHVDEYEADPGFGFMVGAGYEFARHWQAAVYFAKGKTEESPVEFDHQHINILVSGVAF